MADALELSVARPGQGQTKNRTFPFLRKLLKRTRSVCKPQALFSRNRAMAMAVLDIAEYLKKSLRGVEGDSARHVPLRNPNLPMTVIGIADAGLCPLSCLVAKYGPSVTQEVEL